MASAQHRRLGLAVLVGLVSGCTGVKHLVAEGRPCDPEHACGPGTYCDPVTSRCMTSSPDLKPTVPDGPADGPVADRLVFDGSTTDAQPADGVPPDSPPPDLLAPPDIKPPPDTKPPPDLVPPCYGLTCALGCNAAANRCKWLGPSNVPTSMRSSMQAGSTAQLSGKAIEIDTSTGEVKVDGVVKRPAGSSGASVNGVFWGVVSQGSGLPEIAVFGAGSLVLQAAGTLTVLGSRASLVYGSAQVTIHGAVIISPGNPGAAPGGFAGGNANASAPFCFGGGGSKGSLGGCTSPKCESGGGGGGRKAGGGDGGIPTNGTPGGGGGSSNGSYSLVPLYGGCGGGGGGGAQSGDGGGGGGAFQLSTSGTLLVSSSGVISMPGAGGEKGQWIDIQGGGGGGSGGAILLEGANVQVQGVLAANGGGGGGGQHGQDGQPSATPAQGGSAGLHIGEGGDGGAQGAEAGGAGQAGATKNDGGGGGGAAGRIRINGPTKSLTGTISPAASISSSVASW